MKASIKLTKKDRVFLINQYKILAALNKDEESHYLELIEVLERGYAIFYSLIDKWVANDMRESDGRLVIRILELYRKIEYVKRTTKDVRILSHEYSFFKGFDGNEETELMSFCRFLIEKQGKYQEQDSYKLRNDNLNSHMPMLEKYQRMLEAASDLTDMRQMTAEDVLAVLEA